MVIKAIETLYKGYRFRSRLEARWAVFFDALGVAWEYEKQGYRLPSGPYLPDFWLPGLGCWIEIKGQPPTEKERKLADELAEATACVVYLFYGPVPGFGEIDDQCGQSGELYDSEGWDNFQAFCVCTTCGAVGIEYCGRSDRLPCKECYSCANARKGYDVSGYLGSCPGVCSKKCPRAGGNNDRGHTYDDPKILRAVEAARSARFEHGESTRL